MEVLDALLRRAVAGGYLSGCSIKGDRRHNLKISHLFFADDTIVFCEANKEHLTHLSWILLWFEAASGLRINLDKSEIIPVGVVEEIEEMAMELGCRVVIEKYGQEGHGWRAKKAYGTIGVGVWKEIWKESDWCWDNMGFIVGKGKKINFWTDVWCEDTRLSQSFPHLYAMAAHRDATVEEMWDQNFGQGGWNLRFLRDFNDWELEMIGNLLHVLRNYKPSMEEDSVRWKGGRNGKFRVKEAYRVMTRPNDIGFPSRCIWVDSVPTKDWKSGWVISRVDEFQVRVGLGSTLNPAQPAELQPYKTTNWNWRSARGEAPLLLLYL
uniref:Uncharacterized protein n=1 Tax=Vitis vinifera TaxID=29760 RepID=A5C3M2_VITVI|nr:hypothetical protein VITISV_034201 [Vitis vinifera]